MHALNTKLIDEGRIAVRSVFSRIFWFGMLAFSGVSYCKAQDLDDSIAVIAAHEDKINSVGWDVEVTHWILQSTDPVKVASRYDQSRLTGSVLFEHQSGRYRVSLQQVVPWTDGTSPYGSGVVEAMFNGEESRAWSRRRPGTDLPDSTVNARGSISRDESVAFDDSHGLFSSGYAASLGVGYVPPLFQSPFEVSPTKLSTFLSRQRESGLPVSLETATDGTWHFHTRISFPDGDPEWLHIVYDPAGGVISRVYTGGSAVSIEGHWRRVEIDSVQVDAHTWVPKEIRSIPSLLEKPVRMHLFGFSNYRINPALTNETLALTFPVGTRVNDHVRGQTYVVGPEPVDQEIAVRAFLEEHEVRLPPPPTANPWFARLGWILAGGLLLLLAWVLFFRGRAGSSRFRTLLFPCLTALAASCPGTLLADESTTTQGDLVPRKNSQSIFLDILNFRSADWRTDRHLCRIRHFPISLVSAERN
jgi:hypothetical protein